MKLILKSPVEKPFITQPFGVNGEWYQKRGINIKGHNGIDFLTAHGQPVYASHDGFAYYEWDGKQGEGVVIRSKEMFELNDGTVSFIKTVYWHFVDAIKESKFTSPIKVFDINSKGQEVEAGDLIGYADNTGLSTGDHLHWGLKPVSIGEKMGSIYNPLQNNGYLGAIDPMPYLVMPVEKYLFFRDMKFGDDSGDVKELQRRLISMGYSIPSGATGYYGYQTKAAVFAFQEKYVKLTWYETYILGGMRCGKKTRDALNSS